MPGFKDMLSNFFGGNDEQETAAASVVPDQQPARSDLETSTDSFTTKAMLLSFNEGKYSLHNITKEPTILAFCPEHGPAVVEGKEISRESKDLNVSPLLTLEMVEAACRHIFMQAEILYSDIETAADQFETELVKAATQVEATKADYAKVMADVVKEHDLKHVETTDKSAPYIPSTKAQIQTTKADYAKVMADVVKVHGLKHVETTDKSAPHIPPQVSKLMADSINANGGETFDRARAKAIVAVEELDAKLALKQQARQLAGDLAQLLRDMLTDMTADRDVSPSPTSSLANSRHSSFSSLREYDGTTTEPVSSASSDEEESLLLPSSPSM